LRTAHEALREFRMRATRVEPPTLPAVFVLCSDAHACAETIAAWRPAFVVQLLAGADQLAAISAAEVRASGAKSIVICGHTSCVERDGRERLLERCRAVVEHVELGALLREGRVRLEALYFDEPEGDVFRWDAAARRFELLSDPDVERLLSSLA
jgi:hypothetical protein